MERNTTIAPLHYSPDLEKPTPQEEEDIAAILKSMAAIGASLDDHYRHAVRSVHTKNHGIAVGELTIESNLAPHLAQGLFATPKTFPVLARFSTNPGDILPDSVSTARGLALKIVGIENEAMVAGHENESTQDFLFVDGPVLGAVGPGDFRKQMELFEKHLNDPVQLKEAISAGSRAANGVLTAIGKPSTLLATMGGHPAEHPLGAQFFNQAPVRYGDYVAKFSLVPESPELKALTGTKIEYTEFSALREIIANYFATNGGTWLLKVQLAADLEKTPIEDMSKPWKESDAPFETVARLTLPPQPTDSPQRRAYADDKISFDPWHALEAHRPLGGIQRARRVAYRTLAKERFDRNDHPFTEPRSKDDLPA